MALARDIVYAYLQDLEIAYLFGVPGTNEIPIIDGTSLPARQSTGRASGRQLGDHGTRRDRLCARRDVVPQPATALHPRSGAGLLVNHGAKGRLMAQSTPAPATQLEPWRAFRR